MSTRVVALFALTFLACANQTIPAGNLADPSAVAVATSDGTSGGQVVLIAEGDGQDLRVFVPGTRTFLHGPNAISARSVLLLSTLNGVTLPSFRPQRLAGGTVPVSGGGNAKGYAIVAGTAARVAVVDTQTLHTTVSAADAAACASGQTSLSCLPTAALDVATTPTKAYVLLGTDTAGKICAAGSQCILVLTPSIENGVAVLSRDVQAPIALGAGHYDRLRVDAGLTGMMIYVADNSPPDQSATPPGNIRGVSMISLDGTTTTEFRTDIGVRVASPTPDGKYILAVLTDGSVQTLDVTTGLPATVGTSALLPLDFGAPAVDLLFMPCSTGIVQPCEKTVRISSGTTKVSVNVAMLAMGDGTVIPIFPDTGRPQVFTPVNLAGDTALADIGDVGFSDTSGPAPVGLSVTGLTLGITRSETIAVTYQGVLPAFSGRPATVGGSAGVLNLSDIGAFGGVDAPVVNDLVRLHTLGSACGNELNEKLFPITAVVADSLTLALPSGTACTATNLTVAYDVLAADEATGPWVVRGSYSGFLKRVPLGAAVGATSPATVDGTRRYYPPGVGNEGQAFNLTLTRKTETPLVTGQFFSFTTSSGFAPFAMSSTASQYGLAIGLAALNDTLYTTIIGANSLTEIIVPNYSNSGSVTDYR